MRGCDISNIVTRMKGNDVMSGFFTSTAAGLLHAGSRQDDCRETKGEGWKRVKREESLLGWLSPKRTCGLMALGPSLSPVSL